MLSVWCQTVNYLWLKQDIFLSYSSFSTHAWYSNTMTKGWNGHRNKSQHRRITLEKENSPANPTQRMEPRCNNPSWHKIYMLYFHSKLRMSKGTDAQSTHSKILMQIMTKGTDARSTHSKILMQITDYNSQGDNQMDRCLPCSLLHTQNFKGVQNNDRPYMKNKQKLPNSSSQPFCFCVQCLI